MARASVSEVMSDTTRRETLEALIEDYRRAHFSVAGSTDSTDFQ